MRTLVNRKSLMEFDCKIKGHYAEEEDVEEIKSNSKYSMETICARCGVDIKIQMDQDDLNYYIVTEL
jgi:hypothetical protein